MTEQEKYIKVLTWGHGGFAPMVLGADYTESLECANRIYNDLVGLSETSLRVEAQDKRFQKVLFERLSRANEIEDKLVFVRDRQILEKALPDTLQGFREEAERLYNGGVWNYGQVREYRLTLDNINYLFFKRLNEFTEAYKGVIDEMDSPIIKEIKKVSEHFISAGMVEKTDTGYKFNGQNSLLAFIFGAFWCGVIIVTDINGKEKMKQGNKGKFHDKELCLVYGLSGLKQSWYQLAERTPPKGYKEVLDILGQL